MNAIGNLTPAARCVQSQKENPGGAGNTPGLMSLASPFRQRRTNASDMKNLSPPRGRAKVLRDAFALLLHRTRRRVRGNTRSVATLEMQAQHVAYLLERIHPRTPLERLTPKRIARVLELEAQGRRGRELSGGTLRKRASTLKQALELAGRRPRLPEIPYVYEPKAEHLENYTDYCRIRDALPVHRRRFFAAGVWTGQRHKDLEGMRREDFDPDAGWVRVRSSKTARGRGRAAVRVHAAPELVAELAAHWRTLAPGAKLLDSWPHISSQLTRLSERLGLPRTTAHRLRHTFFTWYVRANGFSAELLELGGWRDLTMPSRVYAHASPVRLREQIERTHQLVVERRGSPKISRKRAGTRRRPDGPNDVGDVGAEYTDVPGPCPSGPASAEQVAIVVNSDGNRPVGAEGIEPSTNGLRVRLTDGQQLSRAAADPLGLLHGEAHASSKEQ